MSFNPDRLKQVQEFIFRIKTAKFCLSKLFFKNVSVSQVDFWKQLELILDYKLGFATLIKSIMDKVNKKFGLIWKL